MICYHHTDMDGKSAGWMVHVGKPKGIVDSPESYIPTNYEDKFDKHNASDDVFIVDISISEATYPALINVCKTARTVTWIDHHQTSVEVIKKHKEELQSIKNLTYFVSTVACGAALTYCFFNIPKDDLKLIRQTNEDEYYDIVCKFASDIVPAYGKVPTRRKVEGDFINITIAKYNKNNPTDSVWREVKVQLPKWLYYVDDYDCWKKKDEKTEYFILGVETQNTSVTMTEKGSGNKIFNYFWENISNGYSTIIPYISAGKNIKNYLDGKYHREKYMFFTWEFQGNIFICKNSTGNSWEFLDELKNYDGAILFEYNGSSGLWSYSVYSDEKSSFDCSKFCSQFGGGGHVHASGFSTKELIFSSKRFNSDSKAKARDKSNVIFLGGTTNESTWRQEFIDAWKKSDSPITEKYELYNPVVDDWTEEMQSKEDEVKETAHLNLFVITPEMLGAFSVAEAVECSHYGKVFFAIYDKEKQFSAAQLKSFKAIGDLVMKHGGRYCTYIGDNGRMDLLIDDIIAYV